jgi:hypothetical protein
MRSFTNRGVYHKERTSHSELPCWTNEMRLFYLKRFRKQLESPEQGQKTAWYVIGITASSQ